MCLSGLRSEITFVSHSTELSLNEIGKTSYLADVTMTDRTLHIKENETTTAYPGDGYVTMADPDLFNCRRLTGS